MRRSTILLLGSLLTGFVAGCPEPEDNVTAPGGAPGGPPGGPGGAPGGDPAAQNGAPSAPPDGAPPADGAPAPDGATPPAPGATPPEGGGMEAPPGLASLVKDGKSVTISGKIEGAKEVQVDFTAFDESSGSPRPKALEVLKVTDGSFSVKAPATYDSTIYVSAIQDATGNGPSPDDVQGGGIPVKLDGKDVTITIKMGEMSSESKKLFGPPPDMPAPTQTAPAGGAPGAAGGAPTEPPTAGSGAPPAGGPPPAGGATAPPTAPAAGGK